MMKQITISKIFTAFLLVGLILSACDGVLPSNADLNSLDVDVSISDESADIGDIDDDDDINDDSDDDIDDDDDSSSSLDDDDDDIIGDDDSSSSDDDDEVFTSTVDAVDGNTVTIDGQVYTADLENGLVISDYLTAGQTIEYTVDDNGDEIKIFIDGLGEIELELDDDDDDDDSSSSLEDEDDDDEDDDSDDDHDDGYHEDDESDDDHDSGDHSDDDD